MWARATEPQLGPTQPQPGSNLAWAIPTQSSNLPHQLLPNPNLKPRALSSLPHLTLASSHLPSICLSVDSYDPHLSLTLTLTLPPPSQPAQAYPYP